MAELSADRLEEKAKRENPSRYNPRNPWPKVDAYVKQSQKNKPVELQESTDFSPHKAALRDEVIRLDRRETIRELRAKARRVEAEQQEYARKSSDPLSPEFMTPGGNESVNYFVNDFNDRADQLADLENERVSPRDISKYKATQDIINAAKNSGVTLTDDDVENAVKWGILNSAADRIITAYYAGDEIDARNVLLTLQQGNVVEASLLPEIINDKLIESIEDPTIMESISNGIMTGLGYAVQPFAAANEYVMQGTRSFLLEGAEQGLRANAFMSFPAQVKAFFSGTDRAKVAPGQFDQDYIQEIIDSENYSDLEIQFSLEVARRASLGDPNAIMSTYTDKYLDVPEAASIAKDLMYSRDNPRVQELFRQIDSANLGNTGQVLISLGITPAEYDPARGGETRQDIANVTGFAYSLVADPTLLAAKAFRIVQATKWTLGSLAPGAGSASKVIKQMKLGKLSISSAPYRFFDNFTKDLNKLDELDDAASKATGIEKTRLTAESAALRNAMSRQYDEMPEDLIEDFRRYMPKNDAGKFDVDSAIKYIDESNEAFVLQAGKVSDELALEGASLEAQRALVQSILNEKTFYGRVSSTSQKRTPYVPTMSIAAGVRKGFVNKIISASMPLNKSIKVVDDYVSNAADAKVFAKDFSDNALEIGQAVRKEKFTTPGGLYDATGRLFSSINVKPFVSVSTMEDAKSVYRYARSFFPRRTAQLIANAYRNGTEGSRRLLLSGVIRSAAASRGINLTIEEADNWIRGYSSTQRGLATGIKRGERYGVTVPSDAMPSDVAARIAFGSKEDAESLLDNIDETVPVRRSLSADANGIEHALHLDQTASNVALPSIKDFEILRDQISMGIIPTGKWRNTAGTVAQKATDYWSIGTLFGFRFSLRNAIEETGMYWLTGGKVIDFYKGRKASQAIRNIRPRIYVRVDDNKNVVYDKDGVPELIYKSSLGMFANKKEWFKRQLTSNKKVDDFFEEWSKHNGFRHWMADLVLPATRREDSLIAMQQLARGNPEAFAELAVKSLAAQKRGMNLNAMSKSDEEAYEYLVSSQHGLALLDEIAEASRYLNSGGMPSFIDDVNGISDEISPGVIYGKPKYVSERMGDYTDIRPVQVDPATGRNVYGASFWWRELQRTIDGDGTIGEVAVKGIKDFSEGKISAVEAKALVAKAIRDDDTYGYVEKLSRITDDASIDDFASSYFENTLQHFTKADGSVNKELVEMFFENGEWAGWWKQLPDGTATTRISKDTLIKKFSDSKDRPAFIFGREIDAVPYIPIAGSMPALFSVDRAYGWMGAQNARISREPIFLSNYFKAYEQTADAREALAQSMAKSLGREVKDSDYKVANALYAQQSLDDAFNLTLSYIDNPANRSNLAWKARNISRYYRASEDFYRRLKRMAINSPESFWKAALTYQLTMDSGFVFTDDNGEAYFTYPGNEILQGAVASVAGKFYGINMKDFSNVDPFLIGGKLLGVAPSSDPMQFIPSFSGPLSAATLTTVFQAFPTLGGLRAAALGPYNQPSGSYIQDLISSVAPAGLTKLYRMTDPEELDSQLAQAGIDTIALMLAEGMLETLSITVDGKKTIIDGNKVTPELFKKTDQYKASQAISLGLFISKTLIGLFGAAAPRVYSNTVSEEARGLGIDSMKDAQRDLADILADPKFAEFVEEYSEYSSPYSAALSVWFGMKAGEMIDGEYASSATLLPYTLSSYKTPEDNPILKLSGVRASKELLEWTRTPLAEDLEKNGFGDVRYFLAPKSGEFTWEAWGIAKNTLGLSVTKTEDEKIEELFAMKGKQYDNIIRKEYQDKILAAKSPAEISALKDEMDNLRNQNRALHPQWDTVKGASSIYTESNFRLALRRTRDMLDYIKERDGKLTGDALAIDSAIKIYLEYSAKTAGLTGSTNDVKEYKRSVDAEMQSMFNVVKQESPNAALFIDSVLQELGFKEIYGETFGER